MASVSVQLGVLVIAKDPARPDLAAVEVVADRAAAAGHRVIARQAVADSEAAIRTQLARWLDDGEVDVVMVLSGESEVISKALAPLVTEVLPGFTDLFRWLAFQETGASAMLSSAEAARCGSTFVFVVPGALAAAMDKLILPQFDPATTPRNLVDQIPRLRAQSAADAEGIPVEVPVEKTQGGSGLPARLPAEMRPRPRTGANIVSRNKPVADPPTKPIDVARLERQIARSTTPSHDDVTRPDLALVLPRLPPGAVAEPDDDLVDDEDDDHTATDTVAVQPAPPLPPAAAPGTKPRGADPRTRPPTAPPRSPLPSVLKPGASVRASAAATPTGGVPAAPATSREPKPFSFSTPMRGGPAAATPPREPTASGTPAYPARDPKATGARSPASTPPPVPTREPTTSGTPAYPARDPKATGARSPASTPPPVPTREPTTSGTPAYPARDAKAAGARSSPAFPATPPATIVDEPEDVDWAATLAAAKAEAEAKDAAEAKLARAKVAAAAKVAADARDAADAKTRIAAKTAAAAPDQDEPKTTTAVKTAAAAPDEDEPKTTTAPKSAVLAKAEREAEAEIAAQAKAAAQARAEAAAAAEIAAHAKAAAQAKAEREAEAETVAQAQLAAEARIAAEARAVVQSKIAAAAKAEREAVVAPVTTASAAFAAVETPRTQQPTPPPPLPADNDLPRGAFSYPVKPKRSNVVVKVLAAVAATVLGFLAVVYFLDGKDERPKTVATATPTPPLDAPPADSAVAPGSGTIEPEPEIEMDTGDPPPATGSAAKGSGATTPATRPRPGPPPTPRPRTGSAAPATGSAAGSATTEPPPPPDDPDLSEADLCDEANCVLSNYDRPCCEKYKPNGPVIAQRVGGVPTSLDRSMVRAGVGGIKPRVIACGEKAGVKGTVKIAVVVSPEGAVTTSDVQDSPDAALGTCVAGALRAAKFGKSVEGGSFTYPFVF